ncbi:MAG: flagellar motor protein MotD [Sedimenticolaceae bacterium]
MARRHRQHEEHENLERWLVSYADFVTLLFAFFVVMYAVSSVNEGKYRVLSETLNTVFTVAPRSDDPIQVGEVPRDALALPDGPLAPEQPDVVIGSKAGGEAEAASASGQAENGDGVQSDRFGADGEATRIADELAISLHDYIKNDLLKIHRDGDRIEIEMKERMLFESGAARLSSAALRALREVAKTLARIPSHLQIEGHTDNVPIATAAFPSNWELSAARAASVVHYLARSGIEPWRMAAVGLGEHRPLAENADEKGRAANRRVNIVVLTGQREVEPMIDHEVPWAEGPALEIR